VTEKKIVRKIQDGDTQLLDQLFQSYYGQVYAYCYRHTGHREAAQDLTQETFLRVVQSLDQYREYGKFANYLYVVAGNLCRDYYRRKLWYPIADYERQSQAQEAEEVEDRLAVRQALEELEGEVREAVILRFYQQLRYQDIARILGITVSTAKYRVKQGTRQLSAFLKGDRK
jgi:RNA polymerase sigma factor (sigma-70 family)